MASPRDWGAPTAERRPVPETAATTSPVEELCGVALDVWKQRQLPRTLNGGRELPLVPRTHARQPAGQDIAALSQETAQRPVVLVVKHARAGLAHRTGCGSPSHASSLSN